MLCCTVSAWDRRYTYFFSYDGISFGDWRIVVYEPAEICMKSANAFKDDVDKCLEAGMNGHMSKPIDMSELTAGLAEIKKKA